MTDTIKQGMTLLARDVASHFGAIIHALIASLY